MVKDKKSSGEKSSDGEIDPEMGKLEILKRLREMKQLDLISQNLVTLPDQLCQAMPYMANVMMASFAHNSLSDLDSGVGKLKKLKFLQLNNNIFVHLPRCLGQLPALEMLDMRNNKLVDLDPNVVKKWASMVKLMLRYNRIAAIPREIKYMKNLKFLSIRNNTLIRIPIELNELTSLEVFDARNNQLKSLPPIGNLLSLQELDLQHNALSSIPEELGNMTRITRLSLGYNNLQFPECVCSISSLTELDLEHNCVSYVPKQLSALTSLRVLYLSRNKLTALPDELSALTKLERLLLRDNEFVSIPASISKMTSLSELDLRQNPLDIVKNNDSSRWAQVLKSFSWIPELKMDESYNPNRGEYMQSLDRRSRSAGSNQAPRKSSMTVLLEMFGWSWGSSSPQAEAGSDSGSSNGDLDDLKKMASDLSDSSDRPPSPRKPTADKNRPMVSSFACKSELNERGLVRGKKEVVQNEDKHVECSPLDDNKDRALFCVFDGHAGMAAAEAAIKVVPSQISKQLKQSTKSAAKAGTTHVDDFSEELHYAFIDADQEMADYKYEGCTATAILLWKNEDGYRFLQAANVGDSTAYLCRDREPVCLTEDHKLANKYERERLQASGIFINEHQTHLGGLGVTRALGDHCPKDEGAGTLGAPYISDAYELTDGDTHIIIASDGLWDVMTPDEAMEMVQKHEDAKEACSKLIAHAVKDSRCNDNVTVTVIIL